ncbi:MAG: FAD-binding protein, partial [Gemmataceae bacterium]
MDEAQRKRLHDDLKGLVRGELLFDELSRVLYATDASPFEVAPAGVVVPRDVEDLGALVRYAGENQVQLVPRGGGTGRAGAALGGGVVVDVSVHVRAPPRRDGDLVDVEAGVPVRELTRFLRDRGRRLAIDSDSGEGTVGGLIGGSLAGPRAERQGTARDHTRELRVVLDSGDAAVVGRVTPSPAVDALPGRLDDIVTSTRTLLRQYAGLVREARRDVTLDRCGYGLGDVESA